jgi:hypothetical protein
VQLACQALQPVAWRTGALMQVGGIMRESWPVCQHVQTLQPRASTLQEGVIEWINIASVEFVH